MTSRGRPTFVLATANRHKAIEIAEVLGDAVVLVPRPPDVPDVEETGATLEDNARLKAVALVAATGLPAVADDTGLEVDALGGAPGVYSARFAGEGATYADNVAKLLAALAGVGAGGGDVGSGDAVGSGGAGGAVAAAAGAEQRRARFRTVALARWPDGAELIAEGMVEGTITDAPRGGGGFGYDPVFLPDESDGRTLAELAEESGAAKHRLSHRGRAFGRLAELLAELPVGLPAGLPAERGGSAVG
jgi:XTP/dITP diphosphohydrolase